MKEQNFSHDVFKIKNLKSGVLISNVQKHDKGQSHMSWLPLCVRLTSLTMVNDNSERVEIVMFYGVSDGNTRLARELSIERFINRVFPCALTFTSVIQHLRDHGTCKS